MKNTVRLTALALCAALCGCNSAPAETAVSTSETSDVTAETSLIKAEETSSAETTAAETGYEDKGDISDIGEPYLNEYQITSTSLEAYGDKDNNIILDTLKNTDEIVNSYVMGVQKDFGAAQEIVDSLTEQSIVCYYSVMYSSSAVKEFTDFDGDIKKIVEHKLFRSYSDFQNLLYSTYCDDIAAMIESVSPYIAADEVFLYDLSKSIVVTFDIFQKGFYNEVIDCSDDTITFLCYYSILSSDYSDTNISSIKCEAVKTKSGEWKLNNCIWVW